MNLVRNVLFNCFASKRGVAKVKFEGKKIVGNDAAESILENLQSEDSIQIGLYLKKMKEHWDIPLFIVLINKFQDDEEKILSIFQTTQKIIEQKKLNNCWEDKPILGGNEVKHVCGLDNKQGKVVGFLMDELLKWQLTNRMGNQE